VTEQKKKRRGRGAGPAEERKWASLGRLCAREEKKASSLGARGLNEKRKGKGKGVGPARKEGREERGFSFFLNTFQIHFFKLQSNKKPCIRNMMHNHILFLISLNDI
jgi:hypothetical protein